MKQKFKILYIEYLRTDADLIERKLKDANIPFESSLIYTKEQFITALKKITPDIVLADDYFSAFNTDEALDIVKKNVTKIPFILISAMVSKQFIKDIANETGSGHISKELLEQLPEAVFNFAGDNTEVIERLKLSNQLLQDDINPPSANSMHAETPVSNQNLFDLSMLEEMDDNDYVIDIISIFLNECPKELNEMQKAFVANNPDRICSQAHKLKSSTGLIQANQISDVLAQIEQITKQGKIDDSIARLIEKAGEQYKKIEAALRSRLAQIRQQA